MLENYSICSRCDSLISRIFSAWVTDSDNDICAQGFHVPTEEADYVPSKFGSLKTEILWHLSLDSYQDEETGESDSFGWYALFQEFSSILYTNSQGFVSSVEYPTREALMEEWNGIESDYARWLAEDPNTYDAEADWREPDRTEPDYVF